jgi:hypothetical protein
MMLIILFYDCRKKMMRRQVKEETISIQNGKRKEKEPISIEDASEDESEFISEDDEHGEDQSAYESDDAVYGNEEDLF